MERAVDTDAALGNFKMRQFRRRAGQETECDSSENHENAKEEVVEYDRGDCNRKSAHPERPVPIRPALDMIVFISAPAECGIVHAIILSSAQNAHFKSGTDCLCNS